MDSPRDYLLSKSDRETNILYCLYNLKSETCDTNDLITKQTHRESIEKGKAEGRIKEKCEITDTNYYL